jgi:hypothetical protein
MENGLLSRLQSYFSASFGGRYVEHILKETIEEQPKLAARLFGANQSDVLRVEHRFQIGANYRIADLAFLDSATERPICLIEIKYDDHKNPSNTAQLEDYLNFCRRKDCKFVLLSQHLPPTSLQKRLRDGGLILFSDLAAKLNDDEGSVGGLLRRFFVDKGLVMHKFDSNDLANLKSFIFRLLNPWLGQGRSQTKDAMTGGAADAFGNLLKNMNIIAKEVGANVQARSPTIDFELDPWVDPKKISKDAKEDPRADSISAYNAKKGGLFSVYGRIRLDDRSSSWLQVEFGIGFEANAGDKDLHPFTFAHVYSNSFGGEATTSFKGASIRILDDKHRAVTALKERVQEATRDAIKRAPPHHQIAKLKKLRFDLR